MELKIPNTVEQAFELDKKNGNNLWREALEKEIKALLDLDTFEFKEAGWQPPKDYTKVPLLIKFDVKMDLRRKVRIVAGGHVTDPPTTEVYSSVVARDSVRIMFLIAQLNNLELMMTDIGNAYLNAKTKEKIWTVAGPEFGTMQGRPLVVIKSLYGLKSSGARFHEHLADTLRSMGFQPSKGDPDMWIRQNTHDGKKYYEYVCTYVDDLLVASKKPQAIMDDLAKIYTIKTPSEPETYLGCKYQ